MIRAIGESAGTVWNYLREHPEAPLEEISKQLKLKNGLAFMAIGWLAREGKLQFQEEKKKTKVSLVTE